MKTLLKHISKFLEVIPSMSVERNRGEVNLHKPIKKTFEKDLYQAHIGLGSRAFPLHSDNRIPFFVLNNILGGQSMNSNLNMVLREKHGLVYNIESNYQSYTDTGMFSIFYATEASKVKKSFDLIQKVLLKMGDEPMTDHKLASAKEQIKGQMAMAEENNQNYMLMMAKSILDFGKIDTLEGVHQKVDAITASQLVELSKEIFSLDKMSCLVYQPK